MNDFPPSKVHRLGQMLSQTQDLHIKLIQLVGLIHEWEQKEVVMGGTKIYIFLKDFEFVPVGMRQPHGKIPCLNCKFMEL